MRKIFDIYCYIIYYIALTYNYYRKYVYHSYLKAYRLLFTRCIIATEMNLYYMLIY